VVSFNFCSVFRDGSGDFKIYGENLFLLTKSLIPAFSMFSSSPSPL
jgi:hypothetical protein